MFRLQNFDLSVVHKHDMTCLIQTFRNYYNCLWTPLLGPTDIM